MDASPGYPLCREFTTNGELIAKKGPEYLVRIVRRRLEEAYRTGFLESDFVRHFVKNEAHKLTKIREGRLRLIASLSVVDQVIDKLVFDVMLRAESSNHHHLPVKNGLDFLRGGLDRVFKGLGWSADTHVMWKDITAWDWHFKDWMYDFYYDLKRRLCRNWSPQEDFFQFVFRARVSCVANADIILSCGDTFSQTVAAVMRSGWLCTLSGNSNNNLGIKAGFAAVHYGEFKRGRDDIVAIGDDALEAIEEETEPDYRDYITGHGLPLKHCHSGPLAKAEWCSRNFGLRHGQWVWWTQNFEKHIWNLQNAESKRDMANAASKLLGYCIETCWAVPPFTAEDHFTPIHQLLAQYGGALYRSRDWFEAIHTGHEAHKNMCPKGGQRPDPALAEALLSDGGELNPGPQRNIPMALAGLAAAKQGVLQPVRDVVDNADEALHAMERKLPGWAQAVTSPIIAAADVARAGVDAILPDKPRFKGKSKQPKKKRKEEEKKLTSMALAVELNPGPGKGKRKGKAPKGGKSGRKAHGQALARRSMLRGKTRRKRIRNKKSGKVVGTVYTRTDLVFSGTISDNSGNGMPPGSVIYSTLINPNGGSNVLETQQSGIAALALNYEAAKWEVFDCDVRFEVKTLGSNYIAGTWTGGIEMDPTDSLPSGVAAVQRLQLQGGVTQPFSKSGFVGYSRLNSTKFAKEYFVSKNNSDDRLTSKGKFWLLMNEYPQLWGNSGTSTAAKIPIQIFAHYTFRFRNATLEPQATAVGPDTGFAAVTSAITSGGSLPFQITALPPSFSANALGRPPVGMVIGTTSSAITSNDQIALPKNYAAFDNASYVTWQADAVYGTCSAISVVADVGTLSGYNTISVANTRLSSTGVLALANTASNVTVYNGYQWNGTSWVVLNSPTIFSCYGAFHFTCTATLSTSSATVLFGVAVLSSYVPTLDDRQLAKAGPATVEYAAMQTWNQDCSLRSHVDRFMARQRQEDKSNQALELKIKLLEADLQVARDARDSIFIDRPESKQDWELRMTRRMAENGVARVLRDRAAWQDLRPWEGKEDEPQGGLRRPQGVGLEDDGFEHLDRKDASPPLQGADGGVQQAGEGGQGTGLRARNRSLHDPATLPHGTELELEQRLGASLREAAGGTPRGSEPGRESGPGARGAGVRSRSAK